MASKKNLSVCVFGKEVFVERKTRDKYGRIVGKVFSEEVDCGLEQIKRGLAWHYKRFEKEQSLEDQVAYAQAEKNANAYQMGLWGEPDPIAPWDWRRGSRSANGFWLP